jgi:hypothetical protein
MNAAVPLIEKASDSPPPDSSQSEIKIHNSKIDSLLGNPNRGRGKVARLPKAIRDQLNNMILDGVPYPEIIERLGEQAKHLKPDHIHQWKKHGYQNWLVEREWLELISSKAEFSADILAAPDSSGLHEAGLRIAASQMFDQLMRFTAVSPESSEAAGQPEIFARLVNALSRLTREALNFQKYRDASAKAAAIQLKQADPDRDLADSEFDLLVNRMDKVFKVARRKKPAAPGIPASPANAAESLPPASPVLPPR